MRLGSTDIATDPIEAEAFRQHIRQGLQECLPQDLRDADAAHCLVTREQARRWQQIMHAQGWAAPAWPAEHGGPGWALWQLAIFREEYARAGCPRFENLGIDMIGPTLMHHGTAAQKARFLPGILSFDDYWAQAYSEPDAGSDLASVKTTARREGDAYVVNGTKIWQSFGHWANWALALVRTDAAAARKQDGLSVLLIDLTLPGVTVRPIRFINGAEFHVQLFFDDVRVPLDCLVGAQDGGWSVAKDLLVTERLFLARV
ncbi:MAG: acyl-CoA dehydrogenase family protein, partial [Achromobacter marplatensis]|uniref:acyl-CoA dehydrogenase family protein n=1 Tax=Achromobacter marplatensis TaxID=470868 RepID=UPI003D04CB17